jgi:hypothetical protein
MAATPSQVLTGLKNRLATISGLRAFDYQPDNFQPPLGFPLINSINFHGAMQGGNVQYECTIMVIIGRFSDRLSQNLMDGYLAYSGATSIRAAIEADRTLGGVANTLIVSRSANVRGMTIGEAEYISTEITVTVHG